MVQHTTSVDQTELDVLMVPATNQAAPEFVLELSDGSRCRKVGKDQWVRDALRRRDDAQVDSQGLLVACLARRRDGRFGHCVKRKLLPKRKYSKGLDLNSFDFEVTDRRTRMPASSSHEGVWMM